MKLILTADVDHLGSVGDTVEVKDGYGRNFLLPRGLAIGRFARRPAAGRRHPPRPRDQTVCDREHANEIKTAIQGAQSVSLPVKTAADSGKLRLGSVTAGDVVAAIKKPAARTSTSGSSGCPRPTSRPLGRTPWPCTCTPEIDVEVALEVVGES